MEEDNYFNEEEILKVKIRIHGKLSAAQLGSFITSVSKMYQVMQDYYESEQDLELLSITKGSHVLEFLADNKVWQAMVIIWGTLHIPLRQFSHYIGSNVIWDFMKVTFKKVTLKKAAKNEMSTTEIKSFAEAAYFAQHIAAVTKANLEVDFKNQKMKFENSKAYPPDEWVKAHADEFNTLLQHSLESLPPRKSIHKRKF